MKKILIVVLALFCVTIQAQKKKKSKKAEPLGVIAKNNDLTAELIKNDLYLFKTINGAKKDTLLLKNFTDKVIPTDGVIKSFTSKKTPLYAITWTEKKVNETKGKKEEITLTTSQIWNPVTKKQVFVNEQKSTKIKEQVFLDRLKNASETQERTRNEGYLFTLLPDGDFTLKNKTSESKYTLNVALMKFDLKKK
jgi:hypothetical protein